jgi:hypothetical protein
MEASFLASMETEGNAAISSYESPALPLSYPGVTNYLQRLETIFPPAISDLSPAAVTMGF